MTRSTWYAALSAAFVVLSASVASAQTISGVVTDTTGAVVPDVSVEASSPALIEKSRTVTTNGAGRYSIVSLRPGTYTVTFTKAGFSTVTREGLVLTTDFTAQVNAQFAAGAASETIKVEASTPVVDVQGVANPRVVTREEIDLLPTLRSPDSIMATIPGVTPGFFGSAYRGTQDSLTMVDGMRATLMIGAGPSLTVAPSSSNMYQEFSYSTAIDTAEVGQPGLRINLVPRTGSNQFRGSVYFNYTNDGWQSSNLNDELRAQGLTEPAKTLSSMDINPTFGGPIIKDKLWFQLTAQYTASEQQVLGSFFDADPSPYSYVADPSRPGSSGDVKGKSVIPRITWQASDKDNVSAYYQWSDGKTPYFYSPLFFVTPPPEATAVLKTPSDQFGVRWTRAHSARLLLETSFLWSTSDINNDYRGDAFPWSGSQVDRGLPTARPDSYAILDINTQRLINEANVSDANKSKSMELRAAATYTTGSHSIRTGFSYFRGSYHRPTNVIGSVVMRYTGTVPNSVDLTLPGNEKEQIDGDWGFFVQDRWSIGRKLTLNLGLRADLLFSSVPDQTLPASVWLPTQNYSAQDVLSYKDLSPRIGAAYDLFGNGKTAVKVALARYVAGETVNLTGAVNPIRTIATTDRRTWADLNGDRTIYNPDFSVQTNELGPSTNLNFGTAVPGTVYDPETLGGWFNRPYSWETNVAIQHELFPRVGITGLYYWRRSYNQRAVDNLKITPESFDGPFCVTGPTDARLPGGGGQQICGLYDLKPSFLGQVQNYNTLAENLGTGKGYKEVAQGFEFTVNARLAGGAFVQGGVNFHKTYTNAQRGGGFFGGPVFNTCDVVDNPEVRMCENESPFRPDFSLSWSVPFKWDIIFSGVYQGLAGPNIQASWNAGALDVIPGLGRPLSGGFFATKTIALIEPNQEYLDMRHIFNLRLAKRFHYRRYALMIAGDLYNAFNDNSVSGINTTYGASFFSPVNNWMLPTSISAPRQFRLTLQFDF